MKTICDKRTANILLHGDKLKAFSVRSGTREGYALLTFIQHSFRHPNNSVQRTRRKKRIPNWKGRSKTVTVDNMILHIADAKDAPGKPLELINEFSEVAGYKINIQKSVFLCTNNKL